MRRIGGKFDQINVFYSLCMCGSGGSSSALPQNVSIASTARCYCCCYPPLLLRTAGFSPSGSPYFPGLPSSLPSGKTVVRRSDHHF